MDLYLLNSLTGKLEKFEHDKSKPIKWYTCGPTIYNNSHLGHARTFMSFDIIRRVLTFLGYDIIYVMNITDIDDKIIKKVQTLSGEKEVDVDTYMKFISKMEAEFWEDMDQLNIIRPTVMTRVTDYIDKMIKYIEQIEANGLTYTANGSVYIDSEKYLEKGYNWDVFGRAVATDYTECEFSFEKKNKPDFALWKTAKLGEIKFASKWGEGRPGWHLECSVMSFHVLGESIDIHSGGIDLQYPHHNGEVIQSIAHENNVNNNEIPIKVFLHSGQVLVNGKKMSQSLGNFITIRDFLEKNGTARQLRVLFLLHTWNKPLDFTDDTINEAIMTEKRLSDFYANIDHILRTGKKTITKYSQEDTDFLEFTINAKQQIKSCLLKNIKTKNVMVIILETIVNIYKYAATDYNTVLVSRIFEYIDNMLQVFGLEFGKKNNDTSADKFIDILVDFREDVRSVVKQHVKEIPKDAVSNIFKILDDVRDNKLKDEGIVIEDLGVNKKNNKWKHI